MWFLKAKSENGLDVPDTLINLNKASSIDISCVTDKIYLLNAYINGDRYIIHQGTADDCKRIFEGLTRGIPLAKVLQDDKGREYLKCTGKEDVEE